MNPFHLTIMTPEATVYDNNVESLTLPGVDGSFGIMANHEPLIAAARAGVGIVRRGPETLYFALGESFVEARRNEVVVLADSATKAESLKAAQEKCRQLAEAAGSHLPVTTDE